MTQTSIENTGKTAAETDLALIDELSSFYDRPGFLVRRANQLAVSSFVEELGELRIRPTQMAVLTILSESPGIDQITLARRIGVDRTTISMIINSLAAHGFISRKQSRVDARKKEINTTRAGRACAILARERAGMGNKRLVELFSPAELATLVSLLQRIIDTVPADAPEWVRPDGTKTFGTEEALAKDFPEHANLYKAFGFLLRRAHQTLESLFIETTKPLKLTPRRYGVLRIVEKAQPVEQVSVARWLALDDSTTATLLSELVLKKLVIRAPHPTDRRRRLLTLTEEGKALIAEAQPLAEEASRRAWAVLGPEAETFRNLLCRFIVENDQNTRVPMQHMVTQSLRFTER